MRLDARGLRTLAAALVALTAAAACVPTSRARPAPLPAAALPAITAPEVSGDALERRVLTELHRFVRWLRVHDAHGSVRGLRWPVDAAGEQRWSRLADRWFEVADDGPLEVSGVGRLDDGSRLAAYAASDSAGPVSEVRRQAVSLEAHVGDAGAVCGVAIAAGGEPDEAAEPDRSGQRAAAEDHRYPGRRTLRFLARRGLSIVRVPVPWERVQPRLFGPLDRQELARIRRVSTSAADVGVGVIFDLAGVEREPADDARDRDGRSGALRVAAIGSDAVPTSALVDVWSRLSEELGDDPAIAGYGLLRRPDGAAELDAPARVVAAWDRSIEGWTGDVRHDAVRGADARGALRARITDPGDGMLVTDGTVRNRSCATGGPMLSAKVLVPAGVDVDAWSASLQAQDHAGTFHAGPHQVLTPGEWSTIRASVPTGVLGSCRALGLHIVGPEDAPPTSVWIDDVRQQGRLLPAQVWEIASQAVVSALRAKGDTTRVFVAGHGGSQVSTWPEQHPRAWIIDPLDAVTYDAEHHWDADRDGRFGTYADELRAITG